MIVKCPKCNAHVNYNFKQDHCGEELPVPRQLIEPPVIEEPKPEPKPEPRKPKHRKKTPKRLVEQVLERDKKCVRCGSEEYLYVHHIIHRKHGGKDVLRNLETLCEDCHMEEHEGEPVHRIMQWRKDKRLGLI